MRRGIGRRPGRLGLNSIRQTIATKTMIANPITWIVCDEGMNNAPKPTTSRTTTVIANPVADERGLSTLPGVIPAPVPFGSSILGRVPSGHARRRLYGVAPLLGEDRCAKQQIELRVQARVALDAELRPELQPSLTDRRAQLDHDLR